MTIHHKKLKKTLRLNANRGRGIPYISAPFFKKIHPRIVLRGWSSIGRMVIKQILHIKGGGDGELNGRIYLVGIVIKLLDDAKRPIFPSFELVRDVVE